MSLLDEMDPAAMTDNGMWLWSAVVVVVSMAFSVAITVWWQRRRQKQQTKNRSD